MKTNKNYHHRCPDPIKVRLRQKDRSALKGLLSSGSGMVRVFKKARVLQLLDEGLSAPKAALAAGVSENTARSVGKRYNLGSLETAIYDRQRPGAERLLDAKQETRIVAMICSKAPEGFARWSISLIAKEAINRGIVDTVSDSTISRLLRRHELKPWREKNVVCSSG